jgi:hypothetical protein
MNSYEVTYVMERKVTIIAASQQGALESARRELNRVSPGAEVTDVNVKLIQRNVVVEEF